MRDNTTVRPETQRYGLVEITYRISVGKPNTKCYEING